MKKIILMMMLFNLITSCKNNPKVMKDEKGITASQMFGETINETGALPINTAIANMGANAKTTTKITGVVNEVCKVKGCWMTLDINDTQTIRVTFKDYGFFMPKDIAGRTVVCEGELYNDTTSVEMLQHYAEDGGKSATEIAAIVEPEIAKSFEAIGVILK
jgi:hypothetical protein